MKLNIIDIQYIELNVIKLNEFILNAISSNNIGLLNNNNSKDNYIVDILNQYITDENSNYIIFNN